MFIVHTRVWRPFVRTCVWVRGSQRCVAQVLNFNPVFFLVLQLPPIIFNSGYHIDRSMFLANVIPIFLFAGEIAAHAGELR